MVANADCTYAEGPGMNRLARRTLLIFVATKYGVTFWKYNIWIRGLKEEYLVKIMG